MDPKFIELLVQAHVLTGAVSLFMAPIALAVAKGGKVHRIAGKVFFYGMAFTTVSAIITGYFKAQYVLMIIGFFSFHLIASGYRALYLKRLHRGQKPSAMDKLLQGSALMVNLGLLIWGSSMAVLNPKNSLALVFVLFGLIGSWYAFAQYRRFYTNTTDKRQWFFDHIVGFMAGYIAALSAFSVNVLHPYMPMWLAWTWPTIIGTPLIFLYTGYYRRKFRNGGKLRSVVRELRIHPES